MADSLDTVLADIASELHALERNGAAMATARVRAFVRDVAEATVEWRTRLSESEAALRSGLSPRQLQARHGEWMRQGHAWIDGEGRRARRVYRMAIVPPRPTQSDAFIAGQAAGRSA